MGQPAAGQAAEGHSSGVSGGLRAVHHRQEARHVRPLQPGPEGQDEEDRLPQTSGQGNQMFDALLGAKTKTNNSRNTQANSQNSILLIVYI